MSGCEQEEPTYANAGDIWLQRYGHVYAFVEAVCLKGRGNLGESSMVRSKACIFAHRPRVGSFTMNLEHFERLSPGFLRGGI